MNPGPCGYRGGLGKARHVVPTSLLECNALAKVGTMLMKVQAKCIWWSFITGLWNLNLAPNNCVAISRETKREYAKVSEHGGLSCCQVKLFNRVDIEFVAYCVISVTPGNVWYVWVRNGLKMVLSIWESKTQSWIKEWMRPGRRWQRTCRICNLIDLRKD